MSPIWFICVLQNIKQYLFNVVLSVMFIHEMHKPLLKLQWDLLRDTDESISVDAGTCLCYERLLLTAASGNKSKN